LIAWQIGSVDGEKFNIFDLLSVGNGFRRPLPFRTVEYCQIATMKNLRQPAATFQQTLGFGCHLTLLQ